jgi:hypothetical protein
VIRKEALWAISNITAGNEEQIGHVIGKPSLLDKIFTIISSDTEEVASFLKVEQNRSSLGNL